MECGRCGGAGGQGLSSGGGVGSWEIISLFEVSTTTPRTPPPDPPLRTPPPVPPRAAAMVDFQICPPHPPRGGGVPEPGWRTQITSSRVELVLKWSVKSQLQAWEN